MTTRTIRCNRCGAPLTASERTRFITCQFCQASLRVVHERDSVWTEELEAVEDDVRELQTQVELMQIDQRWQRERVQYMISGEGGEKIVPDYQSARVLAICAVLGILFGVGAFIFGDAELGTWSCVGGVGAWVLALYTRGRADHYESARLRYRNRRRDVVREARRAREESDRRVTN